MAHSNLSEEPTASPPVTKDMVDAIEDQTLKLPHVVTTESSTDTDKIAPVLDEALSEVIFIERMRQYVKKWMVFCHFSPAWTVDIKIVTKEEMPRQECVMEWDMGGILWACLSVREEIQYFPETEQERLAAHEVLELLSRKKTNLVREMVEYLPKALQKPMLLQYCTLQNEAIEQALAGHFGPRQRHLLFDEEDFPEEAPILPVISMTNPVTPLPDVHPSFETSPISLRDLGIEEEEEEEDEEEACEHKAVCVSSPAQDVKEEDMAEDNSWLLDDVSKKDREILSHLHQLGANQQPSFFSSKTQMVLPVAHTPIFDETRKAMPIFTDPSSSRQDCQPLAASQSQAKSPFSRPRLTPLQEQNQAWVHETVQTPSLSLPVIKKMTPEQPKIEEKSAQKGAQNPWQAMLEQFGLAHKGV